MSSKQVLRMYREYLRAVRALPYKAFHSKLKINMRDALDIFKDLKDEGFKNDLLKNGRIAIDLLKNLKGMNEQHFKLIFEQNFGRYLYQLGVTDLNQLDSFNKNLKNGSNNNNNNNGNNNNSSSSNNNNNNSSSSSSKDNYR